MSIFVFMRNLFVLLMLLSALQSFSQTAKPIKKTIQLSGVVVTGDSLKGVPAVSIKIVKTDSIDYSYFFSVLTDADGFFLLMARPGDVLDFKKEGFADSKYTVLDTLSGHYSIIQVIQNKATIKDASQLPEVLPRK